MRAARVFVSACGNHGYTGFPEIQYRWGHMRSGKCEHAASVRDDIQVSFVFLAQKKVLSLPRSLFTLFALSSSVFLISCLFLMTASFHWPYQCRFTE